MRASYPRVRAGLALGAGAILIWGLSASATFMMGKRLGVWQFLAIIPTLGGLLQIGGYLALGRGLRSLLNPPPKLWIAIALGFVAYNLLYTTALVTSRTDAQVVGVSLMNYLWPALTVLFTVWLVPHVHLHGRLILSLALSLAGVLLANGRAVMGPGTGGVLWPYALGGLAAVAWALHCALISRWRQWAQDFAAAPMGFLTVGLVAAVICLVRREWEPMDARAWGGAILTAMGPWAGGYMLWELALHRAPGTMLGLFAAATPVLSTLCLLGVFALTGGVQAGATRYAVLFTASVLIGAGAVLGRGPGSPGEAQDAVNLDGCPVPDAVGRPGSGRPL